MQIFQSAVQKLSLYPTRGAHKNQLQNQCNTISCVSQEISSIYSIFLLLKMALLKKIHQKAQDLQKFGRHLLYIGRTDMAWDSVAGLHALFVP